MQETQIWALGQEDPRGEGMATHSNILAWKIPWMEEPGGLQSWDCRIRHELATKQPYSTYLFRSTNTFLNDREHRIQSCLQKKKVSKKDFTDPIFVYPTSARSGKRKEGRTEKEGARKKGRGNFCFVYFASLLLPLCWPGLIAPLSSIQTFTSLCPSNDGLFFLWLLNSASWAQPDTCHKMKSLMPEELLDLQRVGTPLEGSSPFYTDHRATAR